jgi:FkbM family methyltransferase
MNEKTLKEKILAYVGPSYSELKQDIMILTLLREKHEGTFVEFGAFDGETGSNSLLFEKHYNWKGIIAEPNKKFHSHLAEIRSCYIDHRAVHSKSHGTLEFKEIDEHLGLSTLTESLDSDHHFKKRNRSTGNVYQVELVSLIDLLDSYDLLNEIDYISIDTEGSELSILKSFDFQKYKIKIWTIEHNYVDSVRNEIYEIMCKHNYIRILVDISQYDDWYVKKELLEN